MIANIMSQRTYATKRRSQPRIIEVVKPVYATKRRSQPRQVAAVKAPRAIKIPKEVAANAGWLAPSMSALGAGIGSFVEPGVGTALGGILGRGAGELISKVTGLGDYTVHQNSLLGTPKVVNRDTHGGVLIRHREFIGDLISSSTPGLFDIREFNINPGISNTFPWLSQVAQNYEEYSLEGLIFEYRTMSADALNSTNTALGQVIMSTNYNAASPLFTSKSEMENYEYGHSCKPSVSMYHPIECEPRQTAIGSVLYVRGGSVPSGQDQRLYDWGKFQIATNGFQGTSVNCGEIWVTYQVCLLKPKMYAALGFANKYFHFNNQVGLSNAAPLGSNSTITYSPSNTINIVISGNTILFPILSVKTRYKFTWTFRGTSVVITYPTFNVTEGSLVNDVFDGFAQFFNHSPENATAATQIAYTAYYDIDANTSGNPNILVSGTGTLPSTPLNMDCFILQVPQGAV